MNLLNGNHCWCCDRQMVPALRKRPKRSPVVVKEQFGPRYCMACLRNGRKVVKQHWPWQK